MISIVILMGGVIVGLMVYLSLVTRQIKQITKQLSKADRKHNYQRLHISLINKELEALAACINEHIDESNTLKTRQMQSEEIFKQAVANISHDLRTPLTTTIGYIQMARKPEIDKSKQQEYLQVAESRARDLQQLLNVFFEVSVIEREEYKLNLQPINMSNLLCNALAEAYHQFEEQNIVAHIDIQAEKLMILGEELALKRVIDNLISNTIKYAVGSVQIKLSRQEDLAILEICNPIGEMNISEADRLFDKFYKTDRSRQVKDRGHTTSTGLGLTIVKVLVEKMGGSVACKMLEGNLCIICKWQGI